jgi:hypothetical protein
MKAVLIHAQAPLLYIGAYGNEAVPTPALDRLAAEGIVFDAHETDGGSPDQFLQTLLTGRHAFTRELESKHQLLTTLSKVVVTTAFLSNRETPLADDWDIGIREPGVAGMSQVCDAVVGILDRLKKSADWLLVLDLGRLEQDQLDDPEPEDAAPPAGLALAEELNEPTESPLIEIAGAECENPDADDPEDDELENAPEGPKSLAEEEQPDTEAQSLLQGQAEIAAQVEDLDAFVGWLRDELEERELWTDIAFFFTGQGGSACPDGLCSAGPDHPLRTSLSRLPLIIRLPGDACIGRRMACLTQPADLQATLSTLFGQPPASLHGINLVAMCEACPPAAREYVCAVVVEGETQGVSLTTASWKFLSSTDANGACRRWLFRQPEDRFGMLDLYQQKLEFADRLEGCLRGFLAAAKQSGPIVAPALPSENLETSETKEESAT